MNYEHIGIADLDLIRRRNIVEDPVMPSILPPIENQRNKEPKVFISPFKTPRNEGYLYLGFVLDILRSTKWGSSLKYTITGITRPFVELESVSCGVIDILCEKLFMGMDFVTGVLECTYTHETGVTVSLNKNFNQIVMWPDAPNVLHSRPLLLLSNILNKPCLNLDRRVVSFLNFKELEVLSQFFNPETGGQYIY